MIYDFENRYDNIVGCQLFVFIWNSITYFRRRNYTNRSLIRWSDLGRYYARRAIENDEL